LPGGAGHGGRVIGREEELRRIQAALGSALDATGDPAERFFIALGVLELFSELGAAAPLLIVVDDLHWADSDSREVILFAARRIEAERAVMLLGARTAPHGSWPWARGTENLLLGAPSSPRAACPTGRSG
jgi:hypothetical protein